jgi:hypothetical protein
MAKALVNQLLVIKKQATKGGWFYVSIPGIDPKHKNKMGLVRIKGWVETYEFKQFNLLPMSNGNMMLPLKSTVRKAIGKKEGDRVQVRLYLDKSPVDIPEEILDSLLEAPKAHEFFQSLSDSNKKYYIDWIAEARRIETKTDRIVKMIRLLERRKKFWDWPSPE